MPWILKMGSQLEGSLQDREVWEIEVVQSVTSLHEVLSVPPHLQQ